MCKKLLSIVMAIAVLATMLLSTVILTVSANTLAAGVHPYGNGNVGAIVMNSSSSEEVFALNDFNAKQTVDALTATNYYNTFKPYNHAVENEVVANKTLIASSLESYSDSADNVYGASGKSYKASYISATNAKVTPANGNEQYFHYVRVAQTMIIPGENKDTASVGLWVKSSHKAYMVIRLSANTYGTESFIVSERFVVPEGESFIEIPLSHFVTVNAGYNPIREASGDIRIYNTDIYFKSTESFTGARDIWIDNIGFYNYEPKTGKALHNGDAIVKNSIENYVQNGTAVTKDGTNWNADSKGSIAVCNPVSGTKNDNAYNGNGQSIKYSSAAVSTTEYNRFRTNGKINTNNADGEPTGKNATLAVWIKTDRAIKIFLTADDSTTANSGRNRYRSSEYFLPAGESVLEIPVTDFSTQYVIGTETVDNNFLWDYLGSINFYFKSAVNNGNTNVNVWVDNIAIIPGATTPKVPDTKVTHTDGFTAVAIDSSKWVNKKTATSAISYETNASHSHNSDRAAYRVTYSNLAADTSYVNFYYEGTLSLGNVAPYIYDEDSVLSFWVRADQPMTLRVTYMDYDNNTNKGAQAGIKEIAVPAGESIVKINMSEMGRDTIDFDYRYVYQLQLHVRSNADSYKTSGEIYFDAFGFYDADPSNDVPEKPKPPVIPDTKVTHEIGFCEVEPKAENWITKKPDNTTIAIVDNAPRYHEGKTNIAANSSALKVSYTNLSATSGNVSLYSESRIQISNTAPYIYGEDSVLSFWVFTDQAVNLKVSYMDYSVTVGKSAQCKSITLAIPIGESIVKIPMKDLAPDDNEMEYRFAYQLQLNLYANDETFQNSGNIYFDAFGFYDDGLVINTEPQPMPENSYIWWNFDNGTTLENIPDNWTTRWEGEDGKGIKISLEKDSPNVYGGKGNSLKVEYIRAFGEYTAPNIWIEKRFATMGDGLVFWIKSEEKTNIRIVCLDANVDAIEVLKPVTIGYNVVVVKWSDFTFTDKTKTGVPATHSIAQLQLRPMNPSGTFWFDQAGFINVKNDGSNAYNSVYPPTSYKDWEDGTVSAGDDFESWKGEDDFNFCTAWYFQDKGWITLPKSGNNTVLKMDYDRTDGKRSELVNITQFTGVDVEGGISFWAKSSEKRYYTVKVSIGADIIAVNFLADTNGRTYNIPFSAFWMNNRVDRSYTPVSSNAATVTKIQFISDETCNPPAFAALSDEFSLYIDDLKFVDSKDFLRASDIEYTENGVTLKAESKAFSVGIVPKISKKELTDSEKQEYLKLATDAKEIVSLYNIVASDKDGKSLIPSAAVQLIFDAPEGIDASQVQVYQVYLDGTLSKRPVTVTEDGRVSTSVFRLGDYLLAWGDAKSSVQDSTTEAPVTPTEPEAEKNFPWVVVIVIAAVVLVGGAVALIFVRKGRGK